MASCSIVNKNTKEPLKFYKAENGELFNSLPHALQKSTNNYELGFMNEHEEFVPVSTFKIHSKNTIKGKIQNFIKNEYFLPNTFGKNVFKAQDGLAAEMVEEELLRTHPFSFKRKGELFTFEMENPIPTSYEDRVAKYGEEMAIELGVVDTYYEMKYGQPTHKPTIYDKNQLYTFINKFMGRMGITQMSIEEYKKRYSTVKGLDPDAKVFIDINNKIVATATGNASVEELSEEVAHFIIEAWNQTEIATMLQYVVNTPQYAKYNAQYRELYSKQHSDPAVVENYVRKEILGKMLAETFNRNFNMEDKTDIEKNFFSKLSDIFNKFINFIRGKVTNNEIKQLEIFTNEINNLLFNEKLDERLATYDPMSDVPIMYSVGNMSTISKTLNNLKNLMASTVTDDKIPEIISEGLEVMANRLLNINSLQNELDKYDPNGDEMLDAALSKAINKAINERESIEILRSSLIAKISELGDNKAKNLISTINETSYELFGKLSALSGDYTIANNVEPEIAIKNFGDKMGTAKETIKALTDSALKAVHSDANWFVKLFAHVQKTSNALVSVMGSVCHAIHNKAVTENWEDVRKFAEILIKNQEKLKSFIDGAMIKSDIDFKKMETAKRQYEYDLRKQIGDKVVENLTFDEFVENYNNDDVIPRMDINNYPSLFYTYDKEYKRGYSKQIFADKELGIYYDEYIANMDEIGSDNFYEKMANDSMDRKTSGIDKIDRNSRAIKRRRASNVFNSDGNLKEGLELIQFGDLQPGQIYASFNARGVNKASDFVVVIDKNATLSKEADIAFNLLRWNSKISQGLLNKTFDPKKNFKIAFDIKVKEFSKLSYAEKNKRLKEWVDDNMQFEMEEAYWNNITETVLDTSKLTPDAKQNVESYLLKIKNLKLQRSNIIKVYKMVGDSREIIPENISIEDKHRLATIDSEISNEYTEIYNIYKSEGESVDYLQQSALNPPQLNKAFYNDFKKTLGKEYELSTLEEKVEFFTRNSDRMSNDRIAEYKSFVRALDKNVNIKKYENRIEEYMNILGMSTYTGDPAQKLALKELYLKMNVQSWYKRYDVDETYNNFVREYENNNVDVEELVNNYLNSSDDAISYTNPITKTIENVTMMRMNPIFKYNTPSRRTASEIYEEYLSPGLTDKQKYELLHEMAGYKGLSDNVKRDNSEIKNNPELLKVYIAYFDWHLSNLSKKNALDPMFIFQRTQMPLTQLEQYKKLVKSTNRKEVFYNTLTRAFQYRLDEKEDSYKEEDMQRIPKIGLVKIDESELTDDILAALAWDSYNSNLYKQRVENYSLAMRIMSSFENLKFEGGKTPTDTNYYKMMQEMLDFNLFGKTTTMKLKMELPNGKSVDLSKVINKFRHWTIKQALAFSPIVAMTNLTSGITQFQMLKWGGRKIYKSADDRAVMELKGMFGESLSDVGKFDPQSKLNKILYGFGMYDVEKRFENAQFNRTVRLLPGGAFGMMAMGNFILQSRVTLSKLMEVRLIDGKFYSFLEYIQEAKSKNPDMTDAEVKTEYEKYGSKTMYDYLDADGHFNEAKLKQDGFNGDINNEKTRAMGKIRDVSELVTMEMHKSNEGYAARDPLWSFALSLKKWMVLANTTMFSKERVDINTGDKEIGMVRAMPLVFDIFKSAYKDQKSIIQAYRDLEGFQRTAVKNGAVLSATMTVMFALAMLAKGFADDDDEDNPNYLLQLSSYMMLRNLNETFSGSIGIGDSYYNALQNPIMTLGTVNKIAGLANVGKIGETVQRGKYAGEDKYVADLIKLTWLKNLYTFKDAETIKITRDGYTYFNQEQSLYHLFDLLPNNK